MGWEAQGRQYHGWFGTGTSGEDGSPGGPDRFGDRVAAIVRGAVPLLPHGVARDLGAFMERDSGRPALSAMAAWRAAADLPADRFRTLVGTPAMSPAATASLQAMAREIGPPGDAATASRHLAAVIADGGSTDWPGLRSRLFMRA